MCEIVEATAAAAYNHKTAFGAASAAAMETAANCDGNDDNDNWLQLFLSLCNRTAEFVGAVGIEHEKDVDDDDVFAGAAAVPCLSFCWRCRWRCRCCCVASAVTAAIG